MMKKSHSFEQVICMYSFAEYAAATNSPAMAFSVEGSGYGTDSFATFM